MARREREPGDIAKLAVACAGIGAAFFWIALAAQAPLAPLWTWLVFFIGIDFATGWGEAPVASLVSRNAPAEINATMMAVFKLASAAIYFAVGWLGRFYEPLGPSGYWAMNGAISLAAWC